ncbi:hypothetical protein [Chromobacterium piscinae]
MEMFAGPDNAEMGKKHGAVKKPVLLDTQPVAEPSQTQGENDE